MQNWSGDDRIYYNAKEVVNHFNVKRCSKNKNQTEIWKKPEMMEKVSGFIIIAFPYDKNAGNFAEGMEECRLGPRGGVSIR